MTPGVPVAPAPDEVRRPRPRPRAWRSALREGGRATVLGAAVTVTVVGYAVLAAGVFVALLVAGVATGSDLGGPLAAPFMVVGGAAVGLFASMVAVAASWAGRIVGGTSRTSLLAEVLVCAGVDLGGAAALGALVASRLGGAPLLSALVALALAAPAGTVVCGTGVLGGRLVDSTVRCGRPRPVGRP